MPEAPDLVVIQEALRERVVGERVEEASVLRPSVVRSLTGDLVKDIPDRTIESVERRGKFMLFGLSGGRTLVVNPMLTGAFQWCPPSARVFKRTSVVLSLSGRHQLRYLDDTQMGQVYYVASEELGRVPRLQEQGPDVLDDFSFEDFQQRLKGFHGEIKGVLTRGRVVAGIGNAYADEVLFEAGVYPFKKRKALSAEELRRVYDSSRRVVEEAIPVLRERMGEDLHVKVRDFLKVHNKGGTPCPRCGNNISQITANQRITSYCRRCQPGMLLKN